MLATGIVMMAVGLAGYIWTCTLSERLLQRHVPEYRYAHRLMNAGMMSLECVKRIRDETAGSGVVPGWLSMIGLFSFCTSIFGFVVMLVSLLH